MNLRSKLTFLLALVFLLTACGNRGIPAIKQEALDHKLSVLMITSPQLSDSAKQTISSTLQTWRAQMISYEWAKDISALDEPLLNKIKTRPYDYIYVVGNDLLPEASKQAAQLKDHKWTLMQHTLIPNESSVENTDSAALLQIDPGRVQALKEGWVQQLLAQNTSIEWVTHTSNPIPSMWAPSEEADHIVYLDNHEPWFQQLSLQVRQHASSWVVFYTPVDAASVQKAKTLRVSVMDFNSALTADLNWETIWANRLNIMLQQTWSPGLEVYSDQELKELKIK